MLEEAKSHLEAMERVEFIAFRLEPECERVSDFVTYKHQVNSIGGEQFRKYELTELGLSLIHLKD